MGFLNQLNPDKNSREKIREQDPSKEKIVDVEHYTVIDSSGKPHYVTIKDGRIIVYEGSRMP